MFHRKSNRTRRMRARKYAENSRVFIHVHECRFFFGLIIWLYIFFRNALIRNREKPAKASAHNRICNSSTIDLWVFFFSIFLSLFLVSYSLLFERIVDVNKYTILVCVAPVFFILPPRFSFHSSDTFLRLAQN